MADVLPNDFPDDFDDNPDWSDIDLKAPDHAAMLRAARAMLGLSQAQASALLGLPTATLRNWEQRRTVPDDAGKTLIALVYRDPETLRRLLEKGAA
ncbi:helix-turn-helix domain-containing protein [uncultured Rhodospira sp.]|uniref:helix-turn-helix domain-containing protein n=1 Tax=uncultured Rhodospira sp. TaxID=1936189 RepID=UPI00263660B0|nr:helix-turn-helix domain-containing protein [uncultured Rhodospira sp.]